jgi:hypothetical protein
VSDERESAMIYKGNLRGDCSLKTSNRRNLEVVCSNHTLGTFLFTKSDMHFPLKMHLAFFFSRKMTVFLLLQKGHGTSFYLF